MKYKRAKLQNRILKILVNKSITGESSQAEDTPSEYIYDRKLAESLKLEFNRLNYFLKGLEDDKFVNITLYPNSRQLKLLSINENGKDFIEDGGYVRKYFKTLFKNSVPIFLSIVALIFSGITTINGCSREKDEQNKQEQMNKKIDKLSKRLDSISQKAIKGNSKGGKATNKK